MPVHVGRHVGVIIVFTVLTAHLPNHMIIDHVLSVTDHMIIDHVISNFND